MFETITFFVYVKLAGCSHVPKKNDSPKVALRMEAVEKDVMLLEGQFEYSNIFDHTIFDMFFWDVGGNGLKW